MRYGYFTKDEFFIPYSAASSGVKVENIGHEPLVILKFFEPECNPDMSEKG